MRKFGAILAATIAMVFAVLSPAMASVVTVTGVGATYEEAVNDAKRNAVQQSVGTALKSETAVQDLELIADVIKTRTQGYITSFDVLKKSKKDGAYYVEAKVDVSDNPDSTLMKDAYMVMSLSDPKIAVVIEYYGGAAGYEKFPTMTKAAIREELIRRGFTHIIDDAAVADYVITGKLTVNKAKSIKLPSWGSIGSDEVKMLDTGLAGTSASLDGKIKKRTTGAIVGEFRTMENNIAAADNEIETRAVESMAQKAAQDVRKIFNREAAKAFY